MKISFKKPNLTLEYYSILLEDNISKVSKNDVSRVTNKINYYIDKIDNYQLLINDQVNDNIYYKLLSDIADIAFEKEDYVNILSMMNNKKYKRINRIKTSMLAHRRMATRVEYEAALSERIKKSENYIYNVRNISELTNSKDMILLKEILTPGVLPNYKDYETHHKFSTLDYKNFTNPDSEYYIYMVKYFKENIDKEELRKELDNYVNSLYNEINRITTNNFLINNSKIISNDIKSELDDNNILLKLRKK